MKIQYLNLSWPLSRGTPLENAPNQTKRAVCCLHYHGQPCNCNLCTTDDNNCPGNLLLVRMHPSQACQEKARKSLENGDQGIDAETQPGGQKYRHKRFASGLQNPIQAMEISDQQVPSELEAGFDVISA